MKRATEIEAELREMYELYGHGLSRRTVAGLYETSPSNMVAGFRRKGWHVPRLDTLAKESDPYLPRFSARRIHNVERFWSKVVAGEGEAHQACWLWIAGKNKMGYGRFGVGPGGGTALAHRVAYELMVGDIPDGQVIDHLCRTPACVNPWHLEAVPMVVNTMRGNLPQATRERYAAITHCPKGHEYTPENTQVNTLSTGYHSRQCRICQKERCRNYEIHRKARRQQAQVSA